MTSYLWLVTWFFQVMPIFFFVGGFSNYVAYTAYRARGDSTGRVRAAEARRLLRPSLVFLGIWAVVQVVLHLADIGTPTGPRLWGDTLLLRGMKPPGATVPFGPLWFLASISSWSCVSAAHDPAAPSGSAGGCRRRWSPAPSSPT